MTRNRAIFERLGLSFGRDDRIVVPTEPVKELTDTAGFMQGRSERSIEHRFSVENRHRQPIVRKCWRQPRWPKNAAIRVQTSFSPNATSTEWNGQPGFAPMGNKSWRRKSSKAFSAKYTISTEKGTPGSTSSVYVKAPVPPPPSAQCTAAGATGRGRPSSSMAT